MHLHTRPPGDHFASGGAADPCMTAASDVLSGTSPGTVADGGDIDTIVSHVFSVLTKQTRQPGRMVRRIYHTQEMCDGRWKEVLCTRRNVRE